MARAYNGPGCPPAYVREVLRAVRQAEKTGAESVGNEQAARYFAGIKWGLDNPTVLLVAAYSPPPTDHIHIMRELFESNLLFDDLLPIAKAWAVELHIRKFFCDPREAEFIKRMRRQQLHTVGLRRNWA